MTVLAFECYADQDVYLFLKDTLKFQLQGRHSYSQGEVINDVVVKQRADIGLVDEDPGASHHRRRDAMRVVEATQDLEVRRQGDRHLFIVKPALERCFLNGMQRVDLKSELPAVPTRLEQALARPDPRHADHRRFRDELARLYQVSASRKIATFVTDLERHLQALVGRTAR